jgi:hypothetical protein
MQEKHAIFVLAALSCVTFYQSDAVVISPHWYSPGRTDFVLDHKFYNYLGKVILFTLKINF